MPNTWPRVSDAISGSRVTGSPTTPIDGVVSTNSPRTPPAGAGAVIAATPAEVLIGAEAMTGADEPTRAAGADTLARCWLNDTLRMGPRVEAGGTCVAGGRTIGTGEGLVGTNVGCSGTLPSWICAVGDGWTVGCGLPGGTDVAVGGNDVGVSAVAVGGTTLAVGLGGTVVLVGGTGVLTSGTDVLVAVGGTFV